MGVFRSGAPEEVEITNQLHHHYGKADIPPARRAHAGRSAGLRQALELLAQAVPIIEEEAAAMQAAEQRFAAKKKTV